MLTLSMDDLEKMSSEYPDYFKELFEGAYETFKSYLLLKMDIVRKEVPNEPKS